MSLIINKGGACRVIRDADHKVVVVEERVALCLLWQFPVDESRSIGVDQYLFLTVQRIDEQELVAFLARPLN